jgi:hypothetical protein
MNCSSTFVLIATIKCHINASVHIGLRYCYIICDVFILNILINLKLGQFKTLVIEISLSYTS